MERRHWQAETLLWALGPVVATLVWIKVGPDWIVGALRWIPLWICGGALALRMWTLPDKWLQRSARRAIGAITVPATAILIWFVLLRFFGIYAFMMEFWIEELS